jgi:hypothetical protein
MIGGGQAVHDQIRRGGGDQRVVQRKAINAGAGGGIERALVDVDAGALIRGAGAEMLGLDRLVIGAQAQGDNADRRRGGAVAGGEIDVVAAQRHMADRAQPVGHHRRMKAGRQDQAIRLGGERRGCGQQGDDGNRNGADHGFPQPFGLFFWGET